MGPAAWRHIRWGDGYRRTTGTNALRRCLLGRAAVLLRVRVARGFSLGWTKTGDLWLTHDFAAKIYVRVDKDGATHVATHAPLDALVLDRYTSEDEEAVSIRKPRFPN